MPILPMVYLPGPANTWPELPALRLAARPESGHFRRRNVSIAPPLCIELLSIPETSGDRKYCQRNSKLRTGAVYIAHQSDKYRLGVRITHAACRARQCL